MSIASGSIHVTQSVPILEDQRPSEGGIEPKDATEMNGQKYSNPSETLAKQFQNIKVEDTSQEIFQDQLIGDQDLNLPKVTTRDVRDRIPTEKGHQYRIDRLEQHIRASVSHWRRKATEIEGLLIDCNDTSKLRTGKEEIEKIIGTTYKIMDELELENADGQYQERFDTLEEKHHSLI